jgi:hypothetical protein
MNSIMKEKITNILKSFLIEAPCADGSSYEAHIDKLSDDLISAIKCPNCGYSKATSFDYTPKLPEQLFCWHNGKYTTHKDENSIECCDKCKRQIKKI